MKKTLILAIIAISILVVGCTGKVATDMAKDNLNTNDQQQDAMNGSNQPDINASAQVDASTNTGEQVKDVTSMLSKQLPAYMVTYNVDTVANGQESQATTTMYFGPPDKYRIDTVSGQTEGRVYILGDKSYVCTNAGGSWMCFENPSADKPADYQADIKDTAETNPDTPFVKVQNRKVAGIQTDCYNLKTTSTATFQYEYCLSPEGVPLYIHTVNNGYESTVEATEYSTEVSDDDFKLPG